MGYEPCRPRFYPPTETTNHRIGGRGIEINPGKGVYQVDI